MSVNADYDELKKLVEADSARHEAENKLFYDSIEKRVASIADPKERYDAEFALRKTYADLINNGRGKTVIDAGKFILSIETESEKLKKSNNDLDGLENLPADTKNRDKQIKQKRAEIANLEINIAYHNKKINDAKTHYALFDKINTIASTNPTAETIRHVRNQTIRINNAINNQRGLLATLKENEKASSKAERLLSEDHLQLAKGLLTKSGQEAIKDMQAIADQKAVLAYIQSAKGLLTKSPQKVLKGIPAIRDQKAVLAYIQCERRRVDADTDYQFSRKIFENAVKNANEKPNADATKELKEQLASLSTAIKERDGYKKDLAAAEDRKLNNFNAQMLLGAQIAHNIQTTTERNNKKQQKELAEFYGTLDTLKREAEQEAKKIDDANRLYDFSKQLTETALKEGDAKELAKQLGYLKVAAKEQLHYSDRLQNVQKKLSHARLNPPKEKDPKKYKDAKRYHDVRIKNLEIKEKDATLAHSMMAELIDQAATNKDPSVLPQQCKDLRAGIGGKQRWPGKAFGQTKNRLALKKAEKSELEKTIAKEKNENLLLSKSENSITELDIEHRKLALHEKYASRKAEHALRDHAIGNAFLEKAREKKDPKYLPEQFKLMEATIANRAVFTQRLEQEENRQLNNEILILRAKIKIDESAQKLETAKKELGGLTPNTEEYNNKKTFISTTEAELERREWEHEKLLRAAKENSERDKSRIQNAWEHEKEAGQLLRKVLSPTDFTKEENEKREAATIALAALKEKKKEEKEIEDRLYPPSILRDRDQYRKNLETSEEKRLDFKEKYSHVSPKIERKEEDAKLIYEFSNALIQANLENNDPEKLKAQFAELKVVDQLQKRHREALEKYEKQDSENQRKLAEATARYNEVKDPQSQDHKKALENKEDCEQRKAQSKRRYEDAKKDYEAGNLLLQSANENSNPSQLSTQFSMLKESSQERNKRTEEVETKEREDLDKQRKEARLKEEAKLKEEKKLKKEAEAKQKAEEKLKKENEAKLKKEAEAKRKNEAEAKGEDMTTQKATTAAMNTVPTQAQVSTAPPASPTTAPVQAQTTTISPAHHTIPVNGFVSKVNQSDIAEKQAFEKMAAQTNYEVHPDALHPGDLQVFNKNLHSRTSVADIKFEMDENGEKTVIASFKNPVDKDAIAATQSAVADMPPNYLATNPSDPAASRCQFDDKGIEASTTSAFNDLSKGRHDAENMSLIGRATFDENTAVKHGKIVSQQPSSLEQGEKEKAQGGGLRK